jgi:hypothetical protein
MSRLCCTLFAAVTFVSMGSAQSAAPARATAIQSGTYLLEITFGGGVLEGTLQVTAAGDSLAVTLIVGDHESPVRPGERRGNRLVLESTNPSLQLRYELEFKGETVSGTFTYDGQSGAVTGRRRSAQGR